MKVKEHYDKHLAHFYTWMTGDISKKQKEFQNFLILNGLVPTATKNAIDLGAGFGLQSIPLANIGFNVLAVDFNNKLLDELRVNATNLSIDIKSEDIRSIKTFTDRKPELICCCGDTLTHLDSKKEVKEFIGNISDTLIKDGKVLFTFRDYTKELTGNERFILLKSDDAKILTCVLNYGNEKLNVTDLFYEKSAEGWQQKISSYEKVRISPKEIVQYLEGSKMNIQLNQSINNFVTIIANKL